MKNNSHRPITLLVVEDSLLTRLGILSMCDWEANGISVVGNVENGKQALDILLKQHIDIVLADIKMPVMDGLGLLKEIRKRKLSTRFIVLSAHNEFPLVREALKLGADDYLLKMELEPEALLNTCLRMSQNILENERITHDSPSILPVDLMSLSQNTVRQFFLGTYTKSEQELCSTLGIPATTTPIYCMVASRLRPPTQENNFILDKTILQTISEILWKYGYGAGCIMENYWFAAIFVPNSSDDISALNIETDLSKIITDIIRRIFDITITVSFQCAEGGFSQIPELYVQQHANLASAHAQHNTSISTTESISTLLTLIEKKLFAIDSEGLRSEAGKLTSIIAENKSISNKQLYGICHSLIHIIDRFLSDNNYLSLSWDRTAELLSIAKDCKNKDQYLSWITTLTNRIYLALSGEKDARQIIMQVKRYIDENYHRDISLESVSNVVDVSPSHLSRLFTKKLSVNFITYLTDIRISKAKHYLRNTNYRVKEIGEMVGYNDPYYFSRVFKKATGITPGEYRGDLNDW